MQKNALSSCLITALVFISNILPAQTSVSFSISDPIIQKIYNSAEAKAKQNIIPYGNRQVMKEGAKYVSLWLETQPMGGYMYANRNLEIARNNIEIFMDYQRPDGRLPGVIYNRNGHIEPNYAQFQGFYFPMPAFELYFLLKRDTTYLRRLYKCLRGFDAYLWKTRDSDKDGCLESWCLYDTGEDNGERYNGYPNAWPFDYPPTKELIGKFTQEELKKYCKQEHVDTSRNMVVPIESMDLMSFSYSCRHVLSLISRELKNGEENKWEARARAVQEKLHSYLWNGQVKACFDKDRNNKVMPVLLINNLRSMYFGSFTQPMADAFVKYHLMNPAEFFTKMPLPTVAVNDPLFRNISGNNWSGQPQGLSFQRSIRALENYGHFAELTLIGKRFLAAMADSLKFTQQFDPFTAKPNHSLDGYGPAILTTLELISRFYGIHLTQDKVCWSALADTCRFTYTQNWYDHTFRQTSDNSMVKCYINGKYRFSYSKGARVVTSLAGAILEVDGIDALGTDFQLEIPGHQTTHIPLKPDEIYKVNAEGHFSRKRKEE